MLLHHYAFTPNTQIIDEPRLREELHELSIESGGTITARHINLFKQTLKQVSERLDEGFYQGEDIRDLVKNRAWAVDRLLTIAWQLITWPATTREISLIAVGGYGREELHPYSDVDLLILLSEDDPLFREPLSTFITFLWDLGLKIGHSVRTIDECVQEARNDLTVITNLLETRLLTGSEALHQQLMHETSVDKMWSAAEFLKAKEEEQRLRHDKFNNSEYGLEPNLKNSPGGLRDLQTILWIARRHFGRQRISEIVDRGYMTDSDWRIYSHGQAFLWQIRYALHQTTHRAEDRLLFDHQRVVAKVLGYKDRPGSLAIEQMMRRYYRMVSAMVELNDMLLLHFEDLMLPKPDQHAEIVINKRFSLKSNRLKARSPLVFKRRPGALLELFVLLAQNPSIKGVDANTIRLIRENRHLINQDFRRDVRHRSLFMELLRSPGDVPKQLALMARYGVLGKYLPEFDQIVGLMQYDLFHIYTVDAHTLNVLARMQSFRMPSEASKFTLAKQIIPHLPKLELLWIAGLFHDLGKGRGGDHSRVGAEDVRRFCQRHDLSNRDTMLVTWLVENHLLMSWTAQKRDLAEPDVIREFALKVRNEEYLDYLYLLTVADIDATNPSLWNGWRSALLRVLHEETRRALYRGLDHPINKSEWVESTRQEAAQLLKARRINENQIKKLWDSFGDDYFLTYSTHEIVWQAIGILQNQKQGNPVLPLVLISAPAEGATDGGTKVFLNTPEAPNLFAATMAALEQAEVSIHDARIITTKDGWTLNSFLLLDEQGRVIRSPQRLRKLHQHLTKSLVNTTEYPKIVNRHTPRQLKHFQVKTQPHLRHDTLHQRSILEIIAADRPGLLARIGRIFLEFDISVINAKIATFGERVEDVFFITDAEGKPLQDEEKNAALLKRLQTVLDAEA
ncbi:Bifunctional uridylyltransferase/uridylyl-removing enzyme [Halomonadaceae bacterium LMG 33818]|uniref:[protein-PII] uridylyltransferase n=1 Tax=Cernens ardua TaxID=3402176 RepID=UPI003EDC9F4C